MNRNVESHFAELPNTEIRRSQFDMSEEHITSFNAGRLIPIYWKEILPADTFKISTSAVVRLQTLLAPIFSNVYIDTYFFFVPMRLVWENTKKFFGESDQAWIPSRDYTVPICSFPNGGFAKGTIADYMGIPIGVSSSTKTDWPISLPFRAVALVANEWFRDQNVTDPLLIPTGDADQTGSNGDNDIQDLACGGKPFRVAKYHDYFTSCLPTPLKADPVTISFADMNNYYPVGTLVNEHDQLSTPAVPLHFEWTSGDHANPNAGNVHAKTTSPYTLQFSDDNANAISPDNLWANVKYSSSITINELRLAFQLQKYYEANARSGTRYREIILQHFGTRSPDARMQIPEYLGGHRFPLQIHQVANMSQGESDFLGDLGALSNTVDVHDDVIFSSTEHGYILGFAVARYDHMYPQGMAKEWSRRTKLDYYWPVFAHLGEMPVKKREIYFKDLSNSQIVNDPTNNAVFGYQEAYAEYRYGVSRCSAEMRPGIENSLASWHLADYYEDVPSLSDSWIREDPVNVDRVLAVTSSVSDQIFADFYFNVTATRPMPLYSVPGLVDHF